MPAISATVYPAPAYVQVETNWADQPQATGAAVYRVDCLTGQRVPLRPYVSFSGDYLDLSCGYAVFWDTEPQLDRCVYYCTQAQDAAGNLASTAKVLMSQTFSTAAANGWPTADTGQTFTIVTGAAADFSGSGTLGRIASTAVGQRHTIVSSTLGSNMVVEGTVYPTVSAAGGIIDQGLAAVYSAATDTGYEAVARFNPGGQIDIQVNRINSSSATTLTTVTNIATSSGSGMGVRIKFTKWGSRISMKAWDVTTPEPGTPQLSTIDPAPLSISGGAGGVIRIQAGNANTPFTASWDNLLVTDPCVATTVVEACTPSLVVPSSGDFRLGDPVRPCHDVTLLFDAQIDPDCVPSQGIFFGNMAEEAFAANTNTFLPVNARYPIVVSRTRQAITSSLTIASKTFPDRDAVRTLNEPGSPLFLRGPAEYGIDDRYMAVGDVSETRPVPDHRVTPRVISLPHAEVIRPSGPSTGVCGTRVEDLCGIYPTWDALIAAGLTWVDLLRGQAGNNTPLPASAERDWAEVLSDFTDWTGVNSNNTDWTDVLDGDA